MVDAPHNVNESPGSPQIPDATLPERSALLPADLVDLFLRPTRFFSGRLALGQTPYVVLAIVCYGLAEAFDRFDQEMLRAEWSTPRPYWEAVGPIVSESWAAFWAFALFSGAIAGTSLWLVGGWWYRVRLRWAGASDPDAKLARLVYIYSGFVLAAPSVLFVIGQTLTFANYQEAWASEQLYSVGLLIFPFWAVVVSYRGARAVFDVGRWGARIWFLILPIIGLLSAFGVLAGLATLVVTLHEDEALREEIAVDPGERVVTSFFWPGVIEPAESGYDARLSISAGKTGVLIEETSDGDSQPDAPRLALIRWDEQIWAEFPWLWKEHLVPEFESTINILYLSPAEIVDE